MRNTGGCRLVNILLLPWDLQVNTRRWDKYNIASNSNSLYLLEIVYPINSNIILWWHPHERNHDRMHKAKTEDDPHCQNLLHKIRLMPFFIVLKAIHVQILNIEIAPWSKLDCFSMDVKTIDEQSCIRCSPFHCSNLSLLLHSSLNRPLRRFPDHHFIPFVHSCVCWL